MNKLKLMTLVGVMSAALLLNGCGAQKDAPKENTKQTEQKQEDKKEDSKATEKTEDKKEEVSLSDWDGEWNNMGSYLDKPEVQDAFKTLAKKENVDEKKAKSDYLEKRKCEFNGLKIDGNKITFTSKIPSENGEKIAETEYKFVEKKAVKHGSHMLEWDVFEAVDSNAKYKVLLMMPIHGEEELTHFHMRYGNDKEELFAKEGWFPTFVKPNTTDKQIIGEIEE